jgi:hypothetical protein
MAIQNVKQEPKYKRNKGSSTLDKTLAGAKLIAAGAATYFSGGAAAPLLASSAIEAKQTFGNTGYQQQVRPGSRPEVMSAMDRRAQYQQQDPLQSLKEAQAALAQTDLDPQTRQNLEAPILRALQSRGSMA